MHKHKAPRQRTLTDAGNSELTSAWIAFHANPDSKQHLDRIGAALDRELRRRLPDRCRDDILRGHEHDLRQEVNLHLIGKYHAGNRKLLKATAKGVPAEINKQIMCSVTDALKNAKMQLTAKLVKQQAARVKMELSGGYPRSAAHPAMHGNLWSLPYTIQKELALSLLQRALREKIVKPKTAKMVGAMIAAEISPKKMADRMGVSRQAVHEQLDPVKKSLRRFLPEEEFPLT